jgi:hypothetical protein
MYRWYQLADICYAYLTDIPSSESVWDMNSPFDYKGSFVRSNWFNRGWTLQELIAPYFVEFYASDWSYIGSKRSLEDHLARITRISLRVLRGGSPNLCSTADRMSWAAFRETTRVEDMSYCLLGIFEVNMPLLYGEGERAFLRLQEEVLKVTGD